MNRILICAAIVGWFSWPVVVAIASEAYDCAMIREKVKEHGRVAAYAWALANGYSPKDIARIRKQCGV